MQNDTCLAIQNNQRFQTLLDVLHKNQVLKKQLRTSKAKNLINWFYFCIHFHTFKIDNLLSSTNFLGGPFEAFKPSPPL